MKSAPITTIGNKNYIVTSEQYTVINSEILEMITPILSRTTSEFNSADFARMIHNMTEFSIEEISEAISFYTAVNTDSKLNINGINDSKIDKENHISSFGVLSNVIGFY